MWWYSEALICALWFFFMISLTACVNWPVTVIQYTLFSSGNNTCRSEVHISVIKICYGFSFFSLIVFFTNLVSLSKSRIVFAVSI